MVFLEMFLSNPEKKKKDSVVVMHFCFALIGLEKLMDREFSCPCNPGFNMILISLIFTGPALLALTVMVFIQRPCRRPSSHCAGVLLISLIPPLLWILLLLFEGEYVACGWAHWEGDYILDENLQMKWCKPTGMNDTDMMGTDLLERTENINYYSRFSALALLAFLAAVVIVTVSCLDCRAKYLENQEKEEKPKELSESSVNGSEVELQQTF